MRSKFQALLLLLVASTIAGQDQPGGATTIQLPTFGVAIDASGELTVKSFVDPSGQLKAKRIAAARTRLNADIAARCEFRKVSLARLERELVRCLDEGRSVDESLQFLAGLQRVRCVFLYPDIADVVIAGPAEGWSADASGRVVGLSTGRPVLRLDDLAAALRAFAPQGAKKPFIGCTIDPSIDGLTRLRQFQKTIPSVIHESQRLEVADAAVKGTRSALGAAQIRVFGVSSATHFAQVLVEADYRMKCMAVGLEKPPVEIATFIGSMRAPPPNTLQRWWFTPNYDCVHLSDDGLAMSIEGQGVQLQTEDRTITADGELLLVQASPSRSASVFARSFTERYPAIAIASPVYAELRNLIDLAIIVAWLEQRNVAANVGWAGAVLRDESRFTIETLPVPKSVSCVANAVWVRNRLLLPAGGGVSILPHEALQKEHLLPVDPAVVSQRAVASRSRPIDSWWWD